MKLLLVAFIASAVLYTGYALKCHTGISTNPNQIVQQECVGVSTCLHVKFSVFIAAAGNLSISVEQGNCWQKSVPKETFCDGVTKDPNVAKLISSCNATVCDTDECNVISGQCPSAAVVAGPNLLVLFVTFVILMTSLKVF
ncbi:uncharacterized protein LOC130612271 [Hydractinia symbiolongicarpus]|uniref:uncharacterized protein LOC130612271 n=1 Tax=Hydractinia symbiolongicarpus TaxID=13093 RepID=UPI00254EAE1F|nr:uncharacterized protein LOC130612271 [Hydractinia symbiolongicarpus]